MKFTLYKEFIVVEAMIAVVLVMLGCWIGYGFRPESDIPTVYVDQRGRYQGSNGSVLLMTLDETPIVELPQIQPTWVPFNTQSPELYTNGPFNIPHPSAEIDSPKPRGAF